MTKMILAIAGIWLVGTGVAFNAAAALGNDPIGIVYDGIRNAANLSPEQLGAASNIVNVVLVVIIFFWERHYINIGTLLYLVEYGFAVDFGGRLYHMLFQVQTLPVQIAGAIIGCSLLYIGVALYITADIGLDPFSGLVMTIKDKAGKEYGITKVCFDIGCIILGFVLGGKLGVITIVTALSAGPAIQFLANRVERIMEKL